MPARQLTGEDDLERLLQAPRALLFKHSKICPVSTRAFDEYERWLAGSPEIPNAWLDVIGQRSLSLGIAGRTGVRHESPQALLFVGGEVAWHASHGAITAEALKRWE